MDTLPEGRYIITGEIITMDSDQPRASALGVDGQTIAAVGSVEHVRAVFGDDTSIRAAVGTVVPGFTDSHFYLQRAGLKIEDLFPDSDPTGAEFAEAMARTALEPDWNRPAPPTEADRRRGLRRVQPLLQALGITAVADPWATEEALQVYRAAHASGDLSLRVTMMPYFEGLRDRLTTPQEVMSTLRQWEAGSGAGDAMLRFGAIKVYVDGEGKRSQALRETPWPTTGERGIRAIDESELEEIARFCAQRGWALGVHAIGGGAMRMTMDVLARVDADFPLHDRRFRLIHAYLEPPADVIAQAARLGVLVSTQPAIQWQNGGWLVETLGQAAADSNPLREWADAGVRLALGSDGPYFPFDPLRLLWFVRTRAARGYDGPLGERQRLTAEEALRAATADAAWAAFGDDRGRLVVGALADWAEVSIDPLTCTDEDLLDASVLRTVIGGKVAYAR